MEESEKSIDLRQQKDIKNQNKDIQPVIPKSKLFSRKTLKNPLVIGLICTIIGATFGGVIGYQSVIATIKYERQEELTVAIVGEKEYSAAPGHDYTYNDIMISNPTSNKIAIESLYYKTSSKWLAQFEQVQNQSVNIGKPIPSLPSSIEGPQSVHPYMEIPPNDIVPMAGVFTLSPKVDGDYDFQFCIRTISKKEFCSSDILTLHVRTKTTSL